ncbi:UDP-glucose 4-epimerase GalE [Sphingopyxis terrae]|uniref:UDP-glucose 4-epimerase n=1 Tax=Sphingopyxis terrae subsp. ummariensis TaxID=429001 RepID=A0A1Y6FVK0_9SPHN|nr:UDP-glucose 4-epimerase GalE [Sphingopyxis terrae]PCF91399.1 UDP-glucose 4-epimerase GalE [Sphingopyxis terrae subsp. ummariensis]SMQ76583.1 UDP-galactose 4-epimerase [Sphingopyxis terrae subsp. ummariensis]
MKVFVTGGAGYIGSHTLVQLLAAGHEVCVFDNFANSSPVALDRVRQLTNRDMGLVEADIRDADALRNAVTTFAPDAVVHFAGLKAVGESSDLPLLYYQTNVSGTMNLLAAMDAAGCKRIVFSSSATVYGEAHYLPFDEDHPIAPANPYGRTKAMAEGVIADWAKATPDASAVLLRYFNPVGAHESGRIGEDPQGIPNNLMPFIAQVAVGRREKLAIFGADYDTRDGTGERDYIHVVDLAAAHLAAIDYSARACGCEAINVGTGTGITVKELVAAYERACGHAIAVEIAPRRPGDVASSYARTDKARERLGWTAKLNVEAMCADSWKWQSENPEGYAWPPEG